GGGGAGAERTGRTVRGRADVVGGVRRAVRGGARGRGWAFRALRGACGEREARPAPRIRLGLREGLSGFLSPSKGGAGCNGYSARRAACLRLHLAILRRIWVRRSSDAVTPSSAHACLYSVQSSSSTRTTRLVVWVSFALLAMT